MIAALFVAYCSLWYDELSHVLSWMIPTLDSQQLVCFSLCLELYENEVVGF